VDAKHFLFTKQFDKEMNNLVRSELEMQLARKKQNVSSSEIFVFFIDELPYKKEDV
jgi:hypothetical protein